MRPGLKRANQSLALPTRGSLAAIDHQRRETRGRFLRSGYRSAAKHGTRTSLPSWRLVEAVRDRRAGRAAGGVVGAEDEVVNLGAASAP